MHAICVGFFYFWGVSGVLRMYVCESMYFGGGSSVERDWWGKGGIGKDEMMGCWMRICVLWLGGEMTRDVL